MTNKKVHVKDQQSDFDLPPQASTSMLSAAVPKRAGRTKRPKRPRDGEDDTPKAFVRLMAAGRSSLRRGGNLDDGETKTSKNKKRKPPTDSSADAALKRARPEELKIQPGESLRSFGRRVDAAMPVHFPKGDGSARAAKLNKKRKEKEKAKETGTETAARNEEPEDGDEVRSDDDDAADETKEQLRLIREGLDAAKRKKGRKRGSSPDPWAGLDRERQAIRFGETAAAPPPLKQPKPLLYMPGAKAAVDVEGVPRSAGSLAQREELAGERRRIVEAYRRLMMGNKRDDQARRI